MQLQPGGFDILIFPSWQVRVINVERGAIKPFSCHEARVRCLAAVNGATVLSGAHCCCCRSCRTACIGLTLLSARCSTGHVCSDSLHMRACALPPLAGADDGGVRLFDLRQSQVVSGAQQERRSLIGAVRLRILRLCSLQLTCSRDTW